MRADVASAVLPLLAYVLDELETVDADNLVQRLPEIQDALREKLIPVSELDNVLLRKNKILSVDQGLHYALVSWVDEVFVSHPALKESHVSDHRLELKFDRYRQPKVRGLKATLIPDQARKAKDDGVLELLEVYRSIFCMGFRGTWASDSEKVAKKSEENMRANWETSVIGRLEQYWAKSDSKIPASHATVLPPEDLPEVPVTRGLGWIAIGFATTWVVATAAVLAAGYLVR